MIKIKVGVLAVAFIVLFFLLRTDLILYNGYYLNNKHTSRENSELASTLDKLKKYIESLMDILKQKYPNDKRTTRLLSNWKGNIHEMEHHENKNAFAYNRNKGQYIAVCLHNKDNKLNSFNEIFFVAMHEIAHIMTAEYQHNEAFWDSFRWLIKIASDHGLYVNIDYSKQPVAYCSNQLQHNPYFD